ncbi:ATP-binding protein [Streptomyces sp. NPDC090106]|uniref:ATP-binding protein n=1 Tax=Streptomyces sp. NPDC090106 TaxID=3365946 RepID=UPI0037FF16BE
MSLSAHAHPATLTRRAATLRLPGTREGCGEAREFTRRTLGEWELGHRRDDALSIVSELVANAVVHARPDGAVPGHEPDVWLKLTLRGAHLVCSVTDSGRGLPEFARNESQWSEHGRGLRIVDALAEHWGWTRRAFIGKTVWAMLPTRA